MAAIRNRDTLRIESQAQLMTHQIALMNHLMGHSRGEMVSKKLKRKSKPTLVRSLEIDKTTFSKSARLGDFFFRLCKRSCVFSQGGTPSAPLAMVRMKDEGLEYILNCDGAH